jgi:uncharacterized protein DUF4389
MSQAIAGSVAPHHPIGLIVTDDLERSRLTTFFRLILAIPHLIFVSLWGIAATFALIIAWFAALFTGSVPLALHTFMADWLRYSTRVYGYTLLLANPFPPFSASGEYPIDLRVDDAQVQSRLNVLVRLILAIPAMILANIFQYVISTVAFLAWFYILFTGRMHEGMRNLNAWMLRYELQTYGYVYLLTQRYPSLAGAPSA